jgi:hypothetical protein
MKKVVYSVLFLIFTCATISTLNAQILASASRENDRSAATKVQNCTRVEFESYRKTQWLIKGHVVSVEAEDLQMTQLLGTSAKWLFPSPDSPERNEILEVVTLDAIGNEISRKKYDFYSILPNSLQIKNGWVVVVILRKKARVDAQETIEP